MKYCTGCKHATWVLTAAGNLHRNGDGRCDYDYKLPPLPASKYWWGGPGLPSGGAINRRKELDDHCVYWARIEGTKP